MPQPGTDGWQSSWLGMALDCSRDGRLVTMEHEAGIEQVTGHRLGSGRGYGSGCELRFGS